MLNFRFIVLFFILSSSAFASSKVANVSIINTSYSNRDLSNKIVDELSLKYNTMMRYNLILLHTDTEKEIIKKGVNIDSESLYKYVKLQKIDIFIVINYSNDVLFVRAYDIKEQRIIYEKNYNYSITKISETASVTNNIYTEFYEEITEYVERKKTNLVVNLLYSRPLSNMSKYKGAGGGISLALNLEDNFFNNNISGIEYNYIYFKRKPDLYYESIVNSVFVKHGYIFYYRRLNMIPSVGFGYTSMKSYYYRNIYKSSRYSRTIHNLLLRTGITLQYRFKHGRINLEFNQNYILSSDNFRFLTYAAGCSLYF